MWPFNGRAVGAGMHQFPLVSEQDMFLWIKGVWVQSRCAERGGRDAAPLTAPSYSRRGLELVAGAA